MPSTATRVRSLTCCLDPEPAEVGHARGKTRKAVFDWGLAEHAELAEIIVSELVTNAIMHGEGCVKARISHKSGCLVVEVHDSGAGRPVRRNAETDDESGRGLALIEGLIDVHGGSLSVTDDLAGAGKTVRVQISLAGP